MYPKNAAIQSVLTSSRLIRARGLADFAFLDGMECLFVAIQRITTTWTTYNTIGESASRVDTRQVSKAAQA